jgi:hypothetical protein
MDEITNQVTTGRTGSGNLAAEQTVFVVEQHGYLTGPHPLPPHVGAGQTLHETAGFTHAWDRDRDWFECPHCHEEVTGDELKFHEDGHECDESTLDR